MLKALEYLNALLYNGYDYADALNKAAYRYKVNYNKLQTMYDKQ